MNRVSFSCSAWRSQDKISSTLSRTNRARRRFSLGSTNTRPLVVKLVKPIKINCSRSANEFGIHELLISQAEAQMGTADASVLWKANPAVRQKMASFNLLDGGFHQLAKFPTLFFVDRCLQVLNFGRALANKHHQGDICDSGHPGVADQLWIER